MTVIADLLGLLGPVDGLTTAFRQDQENDLAVFPYATVLDPISQVPALQGDSRALAVRRLLQVDIWQDSAAFSAQLVDDVEIALDGVAITSGFRFRVVDTNEIPEPEQGVTHHAVTVSIVRLR